MATTPPINIRYRHSGKEELQLILDLQRQNLPKSITEKEAREQGFVTVEHDIQLLTEMNEPHGHTIAMAAGIDGGEDGQHMELAGYALTMTKEFRNRLPETLGSFFDLVEKLEWDGKPIGLNNLPYVVMGQVCVAKKFRGRYGVFSGLYKEMARRLSSSGYSVILTAISSKNTRSLRAHKKVGFVEIHISDDDPDHKWVIVGLGI